MNSSKLSSSTPSQKFLTLCTKCKDEDYSSNDIINGMRLLVEKHGPDSIDLNYSNDSGDFAMKYIIKYCRPQIFQFILDSFTEHRNERIDLYVIDNPVVRHNVMHLMVNEMYGGTERKQNALKLIDILFDEQYEDRLRPYELLYQLNDYGDSPISFARKRNFGEITLKLEELKYVHIHDLLCSECNLIYEVAHCIIGFMFVVVERDELDKMKHRWMDVIVSPRKSKANILV